MWSALPKTQKCVVTLCYSPCNNTPTAATIAETTAPEFIDPVLAKRAFSIIENARSGRVFAKIRV
jgi:hypothetical protein